MSQIYIWHNLFYIEQSLRIQNVVFFVYWQSAAVTPLIEALVNPLKFQIIFIMLHFFFIKLILAYIVWYINIRINVEYYDHN